MKHFFISILLFFMSLSFFGQTNYVDVIYLKNGSIIKGIIIEQVPNVKYTIKMADGSQFVFTIDEIEKITKEEVVSSSKKKKDAGEVISNSFISYNYLGMSYILNADDKNAGFRFISENGWKFNNLFLGGGVGIEAYDGIFFVPVYADAKYFIKNEVFAPFVFADAGYAFANNEFDNENHGGFLFGGGMGFHIHKTESYGFIGKIGYLMQNYTYQAPLFEYGCCGILEPTGFFYKKRDIFHSLNISFGISF